MRIEEHVFLDGASASQTSAEYNVPPVGKKLVIQADGTVSALTLEGQVVLDENEWHPIAGIALEDGTAAETIAAEGLYSFEIGGVLRLRMTHTGTAGAVVAVGVVTD